MRCPNCGSENVNTHVVSEAMEKRKHHGWAYWVFFGWFFDLLLWIFLTIPRLFVAIFRKKTKIVSNTYTAAVCQNCGYSWKLNIKK